MTRHEGATTILVLDPLLSVLHELSLLATTVLGEHTNNAGLCAVCGSAWPCERAVTATHNLAVL
jgi:hypothetical protein